ncbi:MAG: LUD domain-containing protein [Chloroflexi bacterium]|nr:LUD domain-containing protein [Chloroflexota bacterium]
MTLPTFASQAAVPADSDETFASPASAEQIERTARALTAHGFGVEVLDDAQSARARIAELLPEGSAVFTAASETLRLSGIADDINRSGRYAAVNPLVRSLDRATQGAEIRRLIATPEVVVGSVSAVTQDGTLVAVSASGSQLPAYAGGAGRMIWIVGAQKIVPDLATALHRIQTYAYPLEDVRARATYGRPSAINKVLIVNAEPLAGRTTVLLLREAIGF